MSSVSWPVFGGSLNDAHDALSVWYNYWGQVMDTDGIRATSGRVLLSFALFVWGCALVQPETAEDVMAQWKGKSKDQLMATYGSPTSERLSDTGATMLVWKQIQRHPAGIGRMGMAEAFYTTCIREFEVDRAGIITAAQQRGCPH